MTASEAIATLRAERPFVYREENVLAIILPRSVTAADVTDRVPDAALNPNSFMGAAELSVRQTYRRMGGPEITAAISNVVAWGEIMNQVHFLIKDAPETGVVKVVKRAGEPFLVYFTTPEKADSFAHAVIGTKLE